MSMQCFYLFIMYIIDRGQQSNPLQPFRHVSLKTDICWFRGCVRLRDYVINGERYLSINEQHEFSYPGIRLMSRKLNETTMCVLQGSFILSFLSWDNTFPWNIKKYLTVWWLPYRLFQWRHHFVKLHPKYHDNGDSWCQVLLRLLWRIHPLCIERAYSPRVFPSCEVEIKTNHLMRLLVNINMLQIQNQYYSLSIVYELFLFIALENYLNVVEIKNRHIFTFYRQNSYFHLLWLTWKLYDFLQSDACFCFLDNSRLSELGKCYPQRCSGSKADFCGDSSIIAVVYQAGEANNEYKY